MVSKSVLFDYKEPDRKAPRFRKKILNILNKELYVQFCKFNPDVKITLKQFKECIKITNDEIHKVIIENRGGFELPEQLGHIFIGTCSRKKSLNPDIIKSKQYGKIVQHKNWDSDERLAKIFYTNFGTKYKFRNNRYWGFKAVRQLRIKIANEYNERWNNYVKVSPYQRVSNLFKK